MIICLLFGQIELDKEAWESINEEFSLNNINLQNFNNGKEFVDVITQYVSDEIKNYGTKNKTESEKTYSIFTDSVWFKTISNEWMPYLLDNKLLAVEQKDAVEKKLSEWKSIVSPQDLYMAYMQWLVGSCVYNCISVYT